MAGEIEHYLNAGESQILDFKAATSWDPKNGKENCCGLVKDIIAFANTFGGHLVIGVAETPGGFDPTGVELPDLASWDSTKVNQFVEKYAEPPIATVVNIRDFHGKKFVDIEIPQFPDTLHICKADGPKGLRTSAIYVRTSNNASAEAKTVTDVNRLIERSIRNRQDALLTQIQSLLVGASVQTRRDDNELFESQLSEAAERSQEYWPEDANPRTGFVEFAAWPSTFDPKRFSLNQLRSAANAANIDTGPFINPYWQGTRSAPFVIEDGLVSTVKLSSNSMRIQYWELQGSGLLYYREPIYEDVAFDGEFGKLDIGTGIGIERFVARTGLMVRGLITVYESLGISNEEVTVRLMLRNTKHRSLKVPGRWTIVDYGLTSQMSEIEARSQASIEEWIANSHQLTTDLLLEIGRRFNFAGTHLFPPDILTQTLKG